VNNIKALSSRRAQTWSAQRINELHKGKSDPYYAHDRMTEVYRIRRAEPVPLFFGQDDEKSA